MTHNVSISGKWQELFGIPRERKNSAKPAGPLLTHPYPRNDICLLLNASVNAYRRLDPHFEAPNQIKASPVTAAP